MERPGSTPSPGRRNSNNLLLQELEALSQSLYKSQPPKRGGSLSTLPNANEGIPLPGLANACREAFMASKNKRHSIANPQSTDSGELTSAGLNSRFSTSAASPSGINVSESIDIRGRRKRHSSPFRWRRGEAHDDDHHERKSWGYHDDDNIIMEDDFERKLEQSAEKNKGFWAWKPVRALSHIGLHRFTCVFSVFVNDIYGLSTSMNGLRLAVYLRKKETRDGAVQTMPSRVYEGTAEFEETLHINCHVYGGKHNSQGFKFQSRSFTISVIAVDAEELDLGRHHLDLSMLLHDTERIEAAGEECNGWNVNYELWGKARGAKLAVSLGYEILDKDGHGSKIGNISSRSKDSHPSSRDRRISKSLPSSTRGTPKMVPAGFSYENMGAPPYNQSEPGRDMFNFIKVEHLSLDDHEAAHSQIPHNWPQKTFDRREGAASHASHLQSHLQGSKFDCLEEEENQEEEEGDFEVVEKGMEIQRPTERMPAAAMDCVEQTDNKEEGGDQQEEGGGEIVKEVVQEDQHSKRLSEINSIFQQINALESVILEKNSNELSLEAVDQNPGNQAFEDVLKIKEDLDGAIKNNVNIDEEADLVEGEFLHMLEEEEDGMEIASILEAAETELQKATQSIESKKRATLLEDAETEALMQEWGLNEDVFQNSPPKSDHPTGLDTTHAKLPDLGEGLGCVVLTRDGGMLASMDPGQFRTGERLVMHASKPVVVPAEMGDNTIEIIQRMAGMGSASMATQAMASMPLDDITGKTLGQIAFEGMASAMTKHGHPEQKVKSVAGSRKPKLAGLQTIENVTEEYVSLDSIAPLSMQKIEEMALEGLKIQAEMAEEEAPYTLPAVALPKHGTLGQLLAAAEDNDDACSNDLMAMAISLEDWSRLDAGLHQKVGEEETRENSTRAILPSHRADEQGPMGNALTIALLVQLRDPLRNYEAVGSPMMALVQAERVRLKIPRTAFLNVEEDEEDQPRFKIKGVHLSGLKWNRDEKKAVWGTEKQCQTGSRWLLANGMAKNTKHPLLKSKLHSNSQSKAKQGESIWSISATSQKRSKDTIRNPDVVFPKLSIWRS